MANKKNFDGIRKQKSDENEDLIDSKREWIFARELKLPNKPDKNFAFFAAGSIFLLFILVFFGTIDSGIRAGKQILGITSAGVEFLQQGNLEQAAVNFEQAQDALRGSNEVLLQMAANLPLGREVEKVFAGSERLLGALELLNSGKNEFLDAKIVWNGEENSSDQQFYAQVKASREYLVQSKTKLEESLAVLDEVNSDIFPGEFQKKFLEARDEIRAVSRSVDEIASLQGFLLALLGGEEKIYLLIFQNNNEARATGGFIGTYGLLHFQNGKMSISKIESIYNLDGQLSQKIAAPGPLQRQAATNWAMRDANWFVDFPSSAWKIIEFAELEGGILPDGVISFTPDVFERLLAVIGPVEMPEYGEVLTPENFRESVQSKTSVDYDRQLNQPKKFLADFAPRLLQKLAQLPREQTLDLANLMLDLIAQKHILMFSLDADMQESIARRGAAGEIRQTDGDYLAIFHSNVGGGKTDLGIRQRVEKKVTVTSGGLSIVKLKITRTHDGWNEKYFPKNLDFMRILVPPQAKLLSASGFDSHELLPSTSEGATTDSDLAVWDSRMTLDEITGMHVGSESGYAVFANWQELSPGETKTAELIYEVPFFSKKNYAQLLQKQPGSQPFEFDLEINYMPGNIVYFYPENFVQEGKTLKLTETVNTDRFYGLVGE